MTNRLGVVRHHVRDFPSKVDPSGTLTAVREEHRCVQEKPFVGAGVPLLLDAEQLLQYNGRQSRNHVRGGSFH